MDCTTENSEAVSVLIFNIMKKIITLLCVLTTLVVSAGAEKHTIIDHTEQGIASWYGSEHHGKKMANGKLFNKDLLTAAHKTLPFGTVVTVTNIDNCKSVDVIITDRGPYVKGRIIDLSEAAFSEISDTDEGIVKVTLEYEL